VPDYFRPPKPSPALKLERQPLGHSQQLFAPITIVDDDPQSPVVIENSMDLVKGVRQPANKSFRRALLPNLVGMPVITLPVVVLHVPYWNLLKHYRILHSLFWMKGQVGLPNRQCHCVICFVFPPADCCQDVDPILPNPCSGIWRLSS